MTKEPSDYQKLVKARQLKRKLIREFKFMEMMSFRDVDDKIWQLSIDNIIAKLSAQIDSLRKEIQLYTPRRIRKKK